MIGALPPASHLGSSGTSTVRFDMLMPPAWPFAFLAGQFYFNLFTQRAAMTPRPFLMSLVITLGIAWLVVSAQALRAASVKPANVLHAD